MAIDGNSNSKEQVYLSLRKILGPDHPRTIQALKDFESQQKLDSFNKPKVTTTSVEQPVGNVSAITSYNNRLNDLILQGDASTERQVQQTQADQKKLKEGIIRSQTGKGFLSVGANSAGAGTPAGQTIAALDLVNAETDSKLATVDANANNIISQTRQQNASNRNALGQQQAVGSLTYASNKEQLDFQKEQLDFQKKQYEDSLAKQKAAATKTGTKKPTTITPKVDTEKATVQSALQSAERQGGINVNNAPLPFDKNWRASKFKREKKSLATLPKTGVQ